MPNPNMPEPIYLDNAAATPLHPRAREALVEALDVVGDARAGHVGGRAARAIMDRARSQVAAAVGAEPDEIIFTAGAAHANALAILGTLAPASGASAPGRVVTTALEHPSVLEAARATGLEVAQVASDEYGRVDVDRFADEISAPGAALASVQHASGDVGTMQPLAECARLARDRGALVHADASHTLPALPVDVRALGVDLLTISGRHAYAGSGIGALFVRRGLAPDPLLRGDRARGRGRREPNVPGAAALGAALQALKPEIPDLAGRLWALSDELRRGLSDAAVGVRPLGHPTQRVPQIVAWAVAGIDAETITMSLEDQGILTGSVPSAPLARAGLVAVGEVVIRMSLGRDSVRGDVERALATAPAIIRNLRAMAERADEAFTRFEG